MATPQEHITDTLATQRSFQRKHAARFNCFRCNKTFTRRANLEHHHRSNHEPWASLRCKITGCGTLWVRHCDLKLHQTRDHHMCAQKNCQKLFKSQGDLRMHLGKLGHVTPYLPGRFVCGIESEETSSSREWGCGKTFNRNSNLLRHHRSKQGQNCLQQRSDNRRRKELAHNQTSQIVSTGADHHESIQSLENLMPSNEMVVEGNLASPIANNTEVPPIPQNQQESTVQHDIVDEDRITNNRIAANFEKHNSINELISKLKTVFLCIDSRHLRYPLCIEFETLKPDLIQHLEGELEANNLDFSKHFELVNPIFNTTRGFELIRSVESHIGSIEEYRPITCRKNHGSSFYFHMVPIPLRICRLCSIDQLLGEWIRDHDMEAAAELAILVFIGLDETQFDSDSD